MLGWHISVYRQANGGASPASDASATGTRVAAWQAGVSGLDWLDELAKGGDAIDLGGNGYPLCYTAMARHLLPRLLGGPPFEIPVWRFDSESVIVPEKWAGRTTIDRAAAGECRPDEWLLVVAFDAS